MKILIRFLQVLLGLLLILLLLIDSWALVQQAVMGRDAPRIWNASLLTVETEDMGPALSPGDLALILDPGAVGGTRGSPKPTGWTKRTPRCSLPTRCWAQ